MMSCDYSLDSTAFSGVAFVPLEIGYPVDGPRTALNLLSMASEVPVYRPVFPSPCFAALEARAPNRQPTREDFTVADVTPHVFSPEFTTDLGPCRYERMSVPPVATWRVPGSYFDVPDAKGPPIPDYVPDAVLHASGCWELRPVLEFGFASYFDFLWSLQVGLVARHHARFHAVMFDFIPGVADPRLSHATQHP